MGIHLVICEIRVIRKYLDFVQSYNIYGEKTILKTSFLFNIKLNELIRLKVVIFCESVLN